MSQGLHASGETNAGIGGVEDGVVVLQELLSNDGVDTGAATVVDPSVVLAGAQAVVAVLGGRDEVLRRSKSIGGRAKLDAEVRGGLSGENGEAGGAVGLAMGVGEEGVVD